MIDSGTMIVRDQALTAYRFTGNHFGSSIDLGRNGRALLVGDLSQQGQVEAGVAVDRVGAAVGEDRRPGPLHVLGARVVAGQLQGEIRLHAAADFHVAAGIHGPAAVGKLLFDEVVRGIAGPDRESSRPRKASSRIVSLSRIVSPSSSATPGAVGVLLAEQPLPGLHDRPTHRPAKPPERQRIRPPGSRRVVVLLLRQDDDVLAQTHSGCLQALRRYFLDTPPRAQTARHHTLRKARKKHKVKAYRKLDYGRPLSPKLPSVKGFPASYSSSGGRGGRGCLFLAGFAGERREHDMSDHADSGAYSPPTWSPWYARGHPRARVAALHRLADRPRRPRPVSQRLDRRVHPVHRRGAAADRPDHRRPDGRAGADPGRGRRGQRPRDDGRVRVLPRPGRPRRGDRLAVLLQAQPRQRLRLFPRDRRPYADRRDAVQHSHVRLADRRADDPAAQRGVSADRRASRIPPATWRR